MSYRQRRICKKRFIVIPMLEHQAQPLLIRDVAQGFLSGNAQAYSLLCSCLKERLKKEGMVSLQIVFSEHHWIGTAEENPEELPMPLPSTLQQAGEPKHLKSHLPFSHPSSAQLNLPV
jgi:hypothetical protein